MLVCAPALACVLCPSAVRRVYMLHSSVPLLCVLQHCLVCYIVFFPSMSWSVLLAARVDCCFGSLSAVFVTCAGVML
jgi:hypothetical protein